MNGQTNGGEIIGPKSSSGGGPKTENKPAMPGSLGKDKMSKGARNVDIGHFDITQPLKGLKNGSHGPE